MEDGTVLTRSIERSCASYYVNVLLLGEVVGQINADGVEFYITRIFSYVDVTLGICFCSFLNKFILL